MSTSELIWASSFPSVPITNVARRLKSGPGRFTPYMRATTRSGSDSSGKSKPCFSENWRCRSIGSALMPEAARADGGELRFEVTEVAALLGAARSHGPGVEEEHDRATLQFF